MIITPLFITFIIIVFVLLWLFIKTIDKRKWLTLLVAIVLTPIVYFYMFYPLINIFSNYHHQKYFNSEAWIEKPALRYEMIDNIEEEHILLGKSKTEIKNLLGQHEWLSWNDSIKDHDQNKWNYNLGIEPGAFNENQECVELVFNNNTLEKLRRYQMKVSFEEKTSNE